ncbi:RDD family protein [Kitasatospora sp. NPDC057512]|uniref:RDD family protein n=1 Tax=Kitasatospora sp. NPDC057512 TaxID=3346154 RepID=UPI0036B4BFCE
MTDRPFAADGDPAVAPEPGYYPDPSIPGFIRYWGGSAWVPGTSRPAPAEGEMPAPPRYATRPPVPGGPAARAVPPPVVLLETVAPEAGGAGLVAPEPMALGAVPPGAVPPGTAPSGAVPSGSVAEVRGGLPAGGGDTGPVYFDQTSGGASFVLGPRVAEVIGGPVFRTVDGPGVLSGVAPGVPSGASCGASSGAPSGFVGAEPPGAVDAPVAVGAAPETAPVPGSAPAPAPTPAPVAGGFESGWQADPRAQRGLMETGDAPRWVSWGVLPEAPDAEQGRAEPKRAPIAAELAATGAPAVAVAVREAPVPAVLASGPVPVVGKEAVQSPMQAPVPVPVPAATAVASKPQAGVAATASAHVAPLPAVRAVRETAVQPRPSAATPVPASSRATRTSRDARTTRIPGPAGLGRRLAARTVDTAVLLVVAVAAGIPLGRSVSDHLQQKVDQARMASALTRRQVQVWLVDDVVLGKIAVLIGILLFVSLLYEVLPVARTGQTFGKRIVRIRVVDAATPAARTRLSLGRSLLRWAVRQLGAVLLLGLVWPVFDRTARRGWQDRAARTRVVRG